MTAFAPLDERQLRHLRHLLEQGLPLTRRPYRNLAEQIGAHEVQVLEQVQRWSDTGLFRRVGLVVNHRALGFTANAMLVLDIDDDRVDAIGQALGREPAVSLCYRRPRRLPHWRFNLFCMIHGREREAVEQQVLALLDRYGLRDRPHRMLFSLRAFKQCGARYTTLPDPMEASDG
ncbi:AsnC-like ligand binding domain protein [compost metagenome]|uniref:Siroheme decarboxylase NirL subunit n=1 Tax=Pseudomonas jinjuensis TaxID=198616 RepID=A0A1H0ITB1_9PSED|nr:Lrp/AsnC family transcriptional regulator [Pseudomonas jinjuensis]SDO34615.1 DNA-binding transcriptional regulator, Lrp family [Pseudomonas jinjuensis]